MSVLQILALAELIVCYIVWSVGFMTPQRKAAGHKPVVTAPASRWGILLQTLGFAFVWAYVRPAGFQKSPASLITAMVLAPAAVAMGWSAARQLGKQWRYEAAKGVSKAHSTPFDGWDLTGKAVATIVGGRVVFNEL